MIFFSLGISLLILELIIRIFLPQKESMLWIKRDKKYGYLMKKNFCQKYSYPGVDFVMEVKTNSLGLRGREFNLSEFSDPEIKKVLLLGDSYTFGYGLNIEDTFGGKLEELLKQSEQRCTLINAGIGGWGTLQALTYGKDHLNLFRPDIIVLTFCENDPVDDYKFQHKLYRADEGLIDFPGKIFLRSNSHLYRFLFWKFHQIGHTLIVRKKNQDMGMTPKNFTRSDEHASFISKEEWRKTREYITDFHEAFIRFNPDGILIVQATIPWNIEIRKNLSSLSNGKNLIYLDLFDETVGLSDKQRHLSYDSHWSEKLHSISAGKLYETILSHKKLIS